MSENTGKRNRSGAVKKALIAAFPKTIPIMMGFLFLGMSYGFYMKVSGFSFVYPLCMSLVIFGGSLEFVTVTMLLGSFAPVQTFLMALMIQARHLFYGIALLEKYKETGMKKAYLIFGMCDESFSINCATEVPENVDKGWFYFFVTVLNQFYWVAGATLGGLLGSVLTFNTEGLDFVMTAMFMVIFLEQWLKEKKHYTALIGVMVSAGCLLVFGADSFLIPTMICILCFLTAFRKPIEKAGGLL
ncbi:MAG: AzlC family ABC transporter permease [Lachnospiraceae bacterium]|nr:AzlC family ABC transporter permease [Lachnospiraceae bacterium]